MSASMTWVPVFKAVAEWLQGYERRQPDLVQWLKQSGIDAGLEDRDTDGQSITLQVIDPFTFFCMFTKYGVGKRKQLFSNLIHAAKLDVPPPDDFDGVPSANAMKVWMFPFLANREDWMIPTLWQLFRQALTGEIDDDVFSRALTVPGTGFAKLTQALFYVAPDRYLPVDAQTRPWLSSVGIVAPEPTLKAYLATLAAVRNQSSESFAQLSHHAWLGNQNGTASGQFDAQAATAKLAARYPGTHRGTTHIAAYRTGSGRQLALDPGGKLVQVFVDARPPTFVSDAVVEYLPDKTRNHHLKNHAPDLAQGQRAYLARIASPGDLDALCDWYEPKADEHVEALPDNKTAMTTEPLNQILFGPPGTGKTYATIERALAIMEPAFVGSREEMKHRFDAHVDSGQVRFVTFHQSFSYEDFVEGIRAGTNEVTRQIEYRIEDGIFKQLCIAAERRVVQSSTVRINLVGRRIWKLSLGEAGAEEGVYQDCIAQGLALIGFGGNVDFSGVQSREDVAARLESFGVEKETSGYPVTALNTFIRQVKVGDLFVVTQGNLRFRAIGEVTSDYLQVPREDDNYSQGRKVNWLRVYETGLPYQELMENRFSQMTIYELRPGSINVAKLEALLAPEEVAGESMPRVLIIDEINRGNLSRIFGELITLIEPSKRAGMPEQLQVTLPYSNDRFSVPRNVYLIGTMNTADRSLATLDIALRRRFSFVEMPPRPELLREVTIAGVKLERLLVVINQRIEALLDRDHAIGHACFMSLKNGEPLDKLASVFRNQIVPLLQEYFFEDWERIAWVLNDHRKPSNDFRFVLAQQPDANLFGSAAEGIPERKLWRLNEHAFGHAESYAGII